MTMDEEAALFDKTPDRTQAEQLNDAAMAILGTQRYGAAVVVSMLRRAAALCSDLPEIDSNLGLAYWRAGRRWDANKAFQDAVMKRPDSASFHGNYGVFLSAIGNFPKAHHHLGEASRLDPDNFAPIWDRALLYLREGNWQIGLAAYDARRKHRGPSLYPEMPAPLWRGEELEGKTLYVQGEQGIGDRFLFGRYFAWIKDRWPTCRIIVCLDDSMVNVFWEYRHIIEFMPVGVPWPKNIDYASFICSLPEVHGTRPHYVPHDPGLIRKRIEDAKAVTKVSLPQPHLPSLKVGLVWTGSPSNPRNHDRSIPIEQLIPLAEDPRVMLYSFQCGPGAADIERVGAEELICNIAPQNEKEGWIGTGLALMEMDLLITVCTSMAHFAGVLQVPCWTLLCADPYWIWLRDGQSTPWYPGMRLFRQPSLDDWQPVITQVRTELSRLADTHLPPH